MDKPGQYERPRKIGMLDLSTLVAELERAQAFIEQSARWLSMHGLDNDVHDEFLKAVNAREDLLDSHTLLILEALKAFEEVAP